MSAGNGQLPLPATYLPDFAKNFNEPRTQQEMLKQIQDNFDALGVQVGSNLNTSGSTSLMGLYSGTWAPYTAVAGFTPYYLKRNGMVSLGGAVTNNSTFTAGQTILTMPAGFRPASTEQFAQVAVGGAGGAATTGFVIVEVAATGVTKFISGVTGGGLTNNMERISLSGITYGAAA